MGRKEQKGNTKTRGQVLLIAIVGLPCLLYLVTTRTTEDQRLIEILARYCYAHYTLIEEPTQKNEHRFLRYGDKLARLSEGKFYHLNEDEVKAFLEPRGYTYEVEEADGRVDYLLAPFVEDGHFEASEPGSLSYDYFLLDQIFVYPYDRYYSDDYEEERDWSPLVFYAQDGCLYLDGRFIRKVLSKLFNHLWDSKVTRVSKMKEPMWYKILYRWVEEIWRETHLHLRSENAAREYFVEQAFESSVPTMLGCVSREYFYRKQKINGTNGLELSYLRSLMEDPSFITLGLLYYLNEVKGEAWARNVITPLDAEGLGELGFENCSLEQIRWAATRAFELKSRGQVYRDLRS